MYCFAACPTPDNHQRVICCLTISQESYCPYTCHVGRIGYYHLLLDHPQPFGRFVWWLCHSGKIVLTANILVHIRGHVLPKLTMYSLLSFTRENLLNKAHLKGSNGEEEPEKEYRNVAISQCWHEIEDALAQTVMVKFGRVVARRYWTSYIGQCSCDFKCPINGPPIHGLD